MQSAVLQSYESRATQSIRWGDPVIADMEYPRTVAAVDGTDPAGYVARSMATGAQPLNLGPWGDYSDTLLASSGIFDVPVPTGPTPEEAAAVNGPAGDGSGSGGGRGGTPTTWQDVWRQYNPFYAGDPPAELGEMSAELAPNLTGFATHAITAILAIALIIIGVIVVTR